MNRFAVVVGIVCWVSMLGAMVPVRAQTATPAESATPGTPAVTATSLPSATASASPEPSPDPTGTGVIETATPTPGTPTPGTRTPTPGSPTSTPTPDTPTPASTPTPQFTDPVGIDLMMNQTEFDTGDEFQVWVAVRNVTSSASETYLLIALDLGGDVFWFWPDHDDPEWRHSGRLLQLPAGMIEVYPVYDDVWATPGDWQSFTFYGALTDCAVAQVYSLDTQEWSAHGEQILTELDPPELVAAYPAAGAEDVARDATLSYLLRDPVAGLDTFQLEVDGELVEIAPEFAGSAEGTAFPYIEERRLARIVYRPPTPFPADAEVRVHLAATDAAGNQFVDEELGFRTGDGLDTMPPRLASSVPPQGGVLPGRGDWLYLVLEDDGSGVDWASVRLEVEAQPAAAHLYHLPQHTVVRHFPLCDLAWGDTVVMTVFARDLAGNSMFPQTVTFQVADPGYTPTPAGPTPTPTPPPASPTPPPTTTATVAPSATPTPSPTPTPLPPAGADLLLNDRQFVAGDEFLLELTVSNPGPVRCVDVYVVLDLDIGRYWFWPSWAEYPPDADAEHWPLEGASARQEVVLDFRWPSGAGNGSARFWAAAIDYPSGILFGQIDSLAFSFR